jgi:ferritin-like metal-binding protein YciE
MAGKNEVMEWLRDAYAMEKAVEETLENHAKEAAANPILAHGLLDHLKETREHAAMIRLCLESNGESIPPLKAALGDAAGNLHNLSIAWAQEELLKNCLTDYATEHFEIACYRGLIAAAERAGLGDVVAVCQGILAEEEEMADWVGHQIPLVAERFIDRQEARRKEDQPRRRAAGG